MHYALELVVHAWSGTAAAHTGHHLAVHVIAPQDSAPHNDGQLPLRCQCNVVAVLLHYLESLHYAVNDGTQLKDPPDIMSMWKAQHS